MKEKFDLDTSAGQFRAVGLIYCIAVALHVAGFGVMEQDHTLLLGALLTLLKTHTGSAGVE